MKLKLSSEVLGVWVLMVSVANGAQYRFSWTFLSGSPRIAGIMDTATDSMLVTSYTNQGDTNYDLLIPDLQNSSVFPQGGWEFLSYRADGSRYNIGDNWDGTIANNWGFISTLHVRQIPYLGGAQVDLTYPWTMYPGLGGYKLVLVTALTPPSAGNNIVSPTAIPSGAGTVGGIPIKNSAWLFAGGDYEVIAIPEPILLVQSLSALILFLAARWRTS